MSENDVKPPRLKERLEIICKEMVEKGILFPEAMSQFELCFIAEVMRKNSGNLVRTAASLRIHRNTLSKKVKNNHRNHLSRRVPR
jgi:transcriptional regulator with PAS, ATPase and Fis domain